jgi:hypothetical protein
MITGYKAHTRPYGMMVRVGNGYRSKERLIYGQGWFSSVVRFVKGIFKPAVKTAIKSGARVARTAVKKGAKTFAKSGIKEATKAGVSIAKSGARKIGKKITKESVKKFGKKVGRELADTAKDIAVDAVIDTITGVAEGKDKNVIIQEQKERAINRGKDKIKEVSKREKELIQKRTRELLREEEARAKDEAKKLQKNLNETFNSVISGDGIPRLGGPNVRKIKPAYRGGPAIQGKALVQLGTKPKRKRRRNLKKV